MHRLLPLLLTASLLSYGYDKKPPKQKEVKIQKSSITREQEIQIGKEAAAEVERQMEVVKNPEIEGWLNRIGAQLAKTPQANAYPFYFQLVNEPSINAFALPGGPMFVHTGLIKAAETEGEVAGVLAHEMSHVALRHGVSQMGHAQTWQTIFGVAQAAAGIAGVGEGLAGTAINTGEGMALNGILSKYSRNDEQDADLNGARMLAAAGYNPIEMAHFFEKLEKAVGPQGQPTGMEAWFASHPPTGKRVVAVSEDIAFYHKKAYDAGTGQFDKITRLVAAVPPPKMKPAAALQPVQAKPRPGLPEGFGDLHTKDLAVAYPGGWKAGQAQAGGSLFIVPEGGVAKTKQGGLELIAGVMIDYYTPPSGSEALEAATKALLQSLQKGDTNLRIERTEPVNLGGKPGLLTRMTTRSSYPQDPEQIVQLYSVVRPAGLCILAFATPKSRLAEGEPIFRQILQSVTFTN